MSSNLVASWRSLLVIALSISLVAAFACGGAEEDESDADTPAASDSAAPAADAPTAVAQAQPTATAEALVGQIATEQPTAVPVAAAEEPKMEEAEVGFTYVPVPQVPGVYWDFAYTGPKPTIFSENPKFAELVKQGKLPPVEERLPDEIKVVQGPDGIGSYGGTWRMTTTGSGPSNRMYWDKKNANEIQHLPHVGFYDISDDGRVYTFRLRKGLNWSDGAPMTMEDIRFAWEDVNLNRTLHETPQTQWFDAVTGNLVKFAIVDDEHWTLTWDTPEFTLMEGEVRPGSRCTSFYFCFYAPSTYMKQFHEDFASPADLTKLIDEQEVGDWTRLWGVVNNLNTHIEMPVMGPFVLTTEGDTLSTWRSNPYYMSTDPAGNQLPYIDGVQSIRVESREVAVFRSMAGETDMHGKDFLIREIPLYRSNQERAGLDLKLWPLPGPGDMGLVICQTCNQDPETGKWMRNTEFRNALSLAFDREAINDTLYLGLGLPKNWVPHPSTPYYPGDEFAFDNTSFDQAKANQILDGLGLTAKDSDGFRLRSDGSGERLSFMVLSELARSDDVTELMVDYFKDVGIEYNHKAMSAPWTLTYPGKEPLLVARIVGNYGANPWFSGWSRCCGNGGGPAFTPDISDLDRSMKRGPNGAVVTEGGYTPRCDCTMSATWEPTAPSDTYPADPSGNIAWLQDNWHNGKGFSRLSPERIEIGKEIFRIHALEKYYTVVMAHSGFWRGTIMNRRNFNNVPVTHVADTLGFYGELYYFTDGVDNIQQ